MRVTESRYASLPSPGDTGHKEGRSGVGRRSEVDLSVLSLPGTSLVDSGGREDTKRVEEVSGDPVGPTGVGSGEG